MGKETKSSLNLSPHADLFANLAEQIKLPFVQIAHATDLMSLSETPQQIIRFQNDIKLISSSALRLIDSYLLSIELQRSAQLQLESVSISSVLYDAAEELREFAHAHECELELKVSGKFGPVMGHRQALLSAMTSLGYSFIEAAKSCDEKAKVSLTLRRSAHGISSGVYSTNPRLTHEIFDRAKLLKGESRQPIAAFDSGASSGVFIADALLSSMGSPLRVAKSYGLSGLATTLMPSRQLSLV